MGVNSCRGNLGDHVIRDPGLTGDEATAIGLAVSMAMATGAAEIFTAEAHLYTVRGLRKLHAALCNDPNCKAGESLSRSEAKIALAAAPLTTEN